MPTYTEMRQLPFVTFTLPSGILSCSRDLAQLPQVVDTISRRGVLLGSPLSFQAVSREYPDLLGREREGGPSALLWKSIITKRSRNMPCPIRWEDIPGSALLFKSLSADEQRFLKFTLNCVTYLQNCDQLFGYAGLNQSLVAAIGDSL